MCYNTHGMNDTAVDLEVLRSNVLEFFAPTYLPPFLFMLMRSITREGKDGKFMGSAYYEAGEIRSVCTCLCVFDNLRFRS
mmetsp:Transcript_36952/g.49968  ORF Transcript_36952/g.49968 Transcript_36952/m.49968 type:complete len:80 (+) Transcript_36952:194-433(+)